MKPLLLPAKSVASRLWGYCWDERDQSPGEPPSAHPPFAAEEALVASTACRARTNKDPKGPPPTGTATTPDIVYSLLPEQECQRGNLEMVPQQPHGWVWGESTQLQDIRSGHLTSALQMGQLRP